MRLKSLEINGFKSFAKKIDLNFKSSISGIVGPNGSGKSNIAEAFRFVLGEQSFKSMRGKRGEDLIFAGNNYAPKQNRASVKLTFDNSDKTLPIDFDEVKIERVVHRDGVNDYFLNGSAVRLKDVIELLASANIGSSGHHIISQGEADKILNASVKDRKEILEEALGLRIFQYKKNESEKKLGKTRENIEQVESLRREIAPHIKYLKKQVEKIELGRQLKIELETFYKTYLKVESEYLKREKERISISIKEPKERLLQIESEISKLEENSQNQVDNILTTEIKKYELELSSINDEKGNLMREIGRLEGQINSLIRLKEKTKNQTQVDSIVFSKENVQVIKTKIDTLQENIDNNDKLKELVTDLIHYFRNNLYTNTSQEDVDLGLYTEEIKKAETTLVQIENDLKLIDQKETAIKNSLEESKSQLEQDKSASLENEKKIIELMSEKNNLQRKISEFAIAEDNLKRDTEAFNDELRESVALVGRNALDYESLNIETNIERSEQIERRRQLERMKIKVEETVGYTNDETIKEFEEVTERDKFLVTEITDLEQSALSLEKLIKELELQIEEKFKSGLKKINKEFQNFFSLMFGGGNASLDVVTIKARKRKDTDILMSMDDENFEEDQEQEEGIDISVNLPRKKIRDLMMLSGGERALTSIALLFAISQVNPPPFIILDETDAALDEANSRKYGEMIENLSEYSQLILITHNRETMSRAGSLYGITMSQGISQLLSISFEEGVEYAK